MCIGTCLASDDPNQVAVLRNVDPLGDTPGIEAPQKPEVRDIRLGLPGDAADRPPTRQIGNANQLSASVGLVYRFWRQASRTPGLAGVPRAGLG